MYSPDWARVGAILESVAYSCSVMPEETPTMRSGSSERICSKLSSADDSTSGAAPPRRSTAHGHVAWGWSPYQSRMPTGTTPRASRASWSVKPTVTTRSGFAGTTVVPYLCSIETGNPAAVAVPSDPDDPAAVVAPPADAVV